MVPIRIGGKMLVFSALGGIYLHFHSFHICCVFFANYQSWDIFQRRGVVVIAVEHKGRLEKIIRILESSNILGNFRRKSDFFLSY